MFDVIILSGGFGTRLKSMVNDLPKPMAPINKRPFLEYLLDHIIKFNIGNIILAIGYKGEKIREYFGEKFDSYKIIYSIEDKPLGTGGAICRALQYAISNDVLVLNGDSFFNFDLNNFYESHNHTHSELSIALKKVNDTSRYGEVKLGEFNKIIEFTEKKSKAVDKIGLINSGNYMINKEWFRALNLPEVFSFERDILEKFVKHNIINGFVYEGYFIDIGIPGDYKRAQEELR